MSEKAKQLASAIMEHVHRPITRPEMELAITPLLDEAMADARRAAEVERDDWHKVADDRAAEIVRLRALLDDAGSGVCAESSLVAWGEHLVRERDKDGGR